jgi:hypothetical protein
MVPGRETGKTLFVSAALEKLGGKVFPVSRPGTVRGTARC